MDYDRIVINELDDLKNNQRPKVVASSFNTFATVHGDLKENFPISCG